MTKPKEKKPVQVDFSKYDQRNKTQRCGFRCTARFNAVMHEVLKQKNAERNFYSKYSAADLFEKLLFDHAKSINVLPKDK